MKAERDKKRILKELSEAPNVSRACQKINITRQTFYRWMKEDPQFAFDVEEAQRQGHQSILDFVESILMKNVSQGNQKAIEFAIVREERKLQKLSDGNSQGETKTLADLIRRSSVNVGK